MASCENCNAVYSERAHVVALAARLALALGFRAGRRTHEGENWDADWRTVVFIDLPTGQVSWHFHDSEWALVATLPEYPERWDGHSTPLKYQRVEEALGWLDAEIARRAAARRPARRRARRVSAGLRNLARAVTR